VRLAATTTAALFTNASPKNIAGLPSLIFAMSESGAEKLIISGPYKSMEMYLNCVGSFVRKTYSQIDLLSCNDMNSTCNIYQPNNVLKSLSGIKYKPLQAGKDKSEAGIQIWRIASGFNHIAKSSLSPLSSLSSTGKKRPRSTEDISATPVLQCISHIDTNEVDLDVRDDIDIESTNADSFSQLGDVSSYSYFILISGRPKFVPGSLPLEEHCAILVADFDTSTSYQLETIKKSIQAFIDSKTLPVPVSLCLHLHDQNGESINSIHGKTLVELFPTARHIFTLDCDDCTLSSASSTTTTSSASTQSFASSPHSSGRILTHFPASVTQNATLHRIDNEMFSKPSGGINEVMMNEMTTKCFKNSTQTVTQCFLLPLQVIPVFPIERHDQLQGSSKELIKSGGTGIVDVESLISTLPLTEMIRSDDTQIKSLKEETTEKEISLLSSILKDDNDTQLAFTFLGTGAAAPSHRRSCSAILLSSPSFLLDCGEGALVKLFDIAIAKIKREGSLSSFQHSSEFYLRELLVSIEGIFISHMHADHHTGLLTVLKNRVDAARDSYYKGVHIRALVILGPSSLFSVLECYFHLFGLEQGETLETFVTFIALQETKPGKSMWVRLQLNSCPDAVFWHCSVPHCRQSFGCALSVPKSSLASTDERLVFLYSGDTRPCIELVQLAREAATGSTGRAFKLSRCSTILIHEATFNDDRLEDAKKKRHSTVSEAFNVGEDIRKALDEESTTHKQTLTLLGIVLTHFSQRYPSSLTTNIGMNTTKTSLDIGTCTISPVHQESSEAIITQTRSGCAFFAIDMMRLCPSDFLINDFFRKRLVDLKVIKNNNE
jgi:ribonuclease BN (tRNA processing enzyme)